MSNSKISALTAATTPLAGTETLPVVQSGVTKQVSVANLTAGRAVSAASMTLTTALAATSGGTGSTSAFVANAIPYASSTTALATSANWTYDGTNAVLLNGSFGIGGTPAAGRTFFVSKQVTGSTSGFGIAHNGQIQSDVTTAVYGFRNDLNTAATAFTLTNYYHYYAQQATIGAGSAITNQYGFYAASTLTGASTANYGFYGNIASGTGRYNFYAAGTAANYFAGTTTIGDNLVIGTSGKGIDFSAASHAAGMTSQLLADYEEGTWTPVLTAASGTFTTVTLGADCGAVYTKVGRLVTFQMWFVTDAITVGTASSDIRISLPFTGASGLPGASEYSAITVSYVASWGGNMPLAGNVRAGEAKMNLVYRTSVNGAASLVQVGSLGTGANANIALISGSYVAA